MLQVKWEKCLINNMYKSFGHVIAKNLGNRNIGEGIDRIRKLDILQEGTNNAK